MAVASSGRVVSRLDSAPTVVGNADGPSWTRSAPREQSLGMSGFRVEIAEQSGLRQVSQPIHGKKPDDTPRGAVWEHVSVK